MIAIPLDRSLRPSKVYVPISWSVTGVTNIQIRRTEIAREGEQERWMVGEIERGRERERDYGENYSKERERERERLTDREEREKELKIDKSGIQCTSS